MGQWNRSIKCLATLVAISITLVPFALAQTPPTASTTSRPGSAVTNQPTWTQLNPQQQKALAPLINTWDQLPAYQRQRLLATAKRYSQMTPVEQTRYSRRLIKWAKLPLAQRDLVRERYKKFESLRPEQREEILRRWAEEHPATAAQAAPPAVRPEPLSVIDNRITGETPTNTEEKNNP